MSRYYPTTMQLTVDLPPLTAKAADLEAKLATVKDDKAELKKVREEIRTILHGPRKERAPRQPSATAKPKAKKSAGKSNAQAGSQVTA